MQTKTNKDELKQQILYWMCAGFVYSMLFWTYLNSLLAILISVYWLFFLKKKFIPSSKRSGMIILFTSLFLLALAGLTYTSNMKEGIAIVQKQSALLFFPLIFGTCSVLTPLSVKKLTNHFLIATVLACMIGLVIGLYNLVITEEIAAITGRGILVFHAFNPIIMGLYCLFALVIIFTGDNSSQTKTGKWLLVITVVLSVFIFLLSIRTIIFCWLLLMLFFLWKKIKSQTTRFAMITGLAVLTVITGFTITPLKKQWSELFDFSGRTSIVLDADSSLIRPWRGKAIRVAIWKCSGDIIKRHWLTGVGTGDVQDSLQQAYEDRKFYFASRYNKYNAHNQYLQSAIGHGIGGSFLFALCIAIPLYQNRRNSSNNIYILFLALFAITAVTESVLEINKGIVLYSFFNSIFAFTNFNNNS